MVDIVHWMRIGAGERRERAPVGSRPVFDAEGTLIGTVNSGGIVLDADGVQMGVEWPDGEIVDFGGVQIGHVQSDCSMFR